MSKPINSDTKTCTLRVDKKDLEMFNRLYPSLSSLFIQRCFKFALRSRNNFEKIFFDFNEEVK